MEEEQEEKKPESLEPIPFPWQKLLGNLWRDKWYLFIIFMLIMVLLAYHYSHLLVVQDLNIYWKNNMKLRGCWYESQPVEPFYRDLNFTDIFNREPYIPEETGGGGEP